jgi:hypothetical protein
LPIRLSDWWPLLVVVIGCGDAVWAEDFQTEYRFHEPETTGMPAWFPDRQKSSNWAPRASDSGLNTNNPGPSIQPIPQGNSFTPPVTDYAEPPAGLPPGLYRQVEQRHTITPHHEGYRFRPIDPVEQTRNKLRSDEERTRGMADTKQRPTGNNFYNGNTPMEGRQPKPIYRPDNRLDKGSRQNSRRYPYQSGATMPQFRPQ